MIPRDALCDALARAHDFDGALVAVRHALEQLGVARAEIRLEPGPPANDDAIPLAILDSRGVVVTIDCSASGSFSTQQVRDLMVIATRLSVWCTERGVTRPDLRRVRLTPRQLSIARLAARGETNAEIAAHLGISVNTVKARLKEVFERLDVCNRTELATMLVPKNLR